MPTYYKDLSFPVYATELFARLAVLAVLGLVCLGIHSCSKNENLNYKNTPSVERKIGSEYNPSKLERGVEEL